MSDKSADFLLRHIRVHEWRNTFQDWAIKAPGNTIPSVSSVTPNARRTMEVSNLIKLGTSKFGNLYYCVEA